MFQGVYTAIITPFRQGKVDEKKLEELVTLQVEAGVQGVVACATTGEGLFLSSAEQTRIIEICANICKGKLRVIASTSTLLADETITQTRAAQKAGATDVLIVTPWYIKPSQESLYHYYKNISENVDLPIIIYNNPSRTGVSMALETLIRLMSFKNLLGYKDCSSNLQRISELKCQLGDRLSLLTGNDDIVAAHLGMGGDGILIPTPLIVPNLFVALMRSWKDGNISLFTDTWKAVFPLISALGLESNPAPIKYAASLVYGVSLESRLPFFPFISTSTRHAIEEALQGLGLWEPLARVRER